MTFDVHIVPHTHWDREWYLPLARFRQRLVALVDELLDDPPPPGESFLLDGQAIVVEDYLQVRPERRDALVSLLRAGRLEAGPWYVLGDELIPSGEAIVRNLFTGRRVLARLDAAIPPVLYCPDSFGHPAALPAIAAGFGFPIIIAWRGYGSARWPAGDTVRWCAPSGASAILFHLPRDGYEFGSHLPLEAGAAESRWRKMRSELFPRSTTGVVLIQNGADHHARQAHFREALGALSHAGADDDVHASSLTSFAQRLVERANDTTLATVNGELRDSYGYTWTLQGTFATRAHEKRLNALAERSLVREAEPFAALAGIARASRAVRKPLLDAAWRTLLAAHPHDTLCGCSIDEVAAAMEVRLHSAVDQANGIRNDAIDDLVGYDAAVSRETPERWAPMMIIRNAAPRARSGVAIVEIEQFIADVPVGPGSAPVEPSASLTGGDILPPVPRALGPLQVLSRERMNRRIESPRHYPDNDLVAVTQAALWVDAVDGYGIASLALEGAPSRSVAPLDRVAATRTGMRNAHLAVDVDASGRVSLVEMGSERHIASLLELVDESDIGDLYTPAPRARAYDVEYRGLRRVHRGPLRGELELRYRIVDRAAQRRAAHVELTVRLTLDAAARYLRVAIAGANRGMNHRLRLAFNTNVRGAAVYADAAFGPVRRESVVVAPDERRMESPPPTAPLHRYVSLFGAADGATVFSDGLAEYEHRDGGTLLVTLVRSVGELSINDLPERPGHAGWPTPTPAAQCLGSFAAELAIMLHGPRSRETIDAIEQTADDVLLPLAGRTMRAALRVPDPVKGVELVGAGLAFSALKPAEQGEGSGVVLRCVNLSDEATTGRWRFGFRPRRAALTRLDETEIRELELRGDEVVFHAGPREIVTIVVR